MRRINYVAAILVLPTLLYAALVITNPANYFVDGKGERLFSIAYILASYDGKASAIQLIGTTVIVFGIIISQEKWPVRIASLAGAMVVWLGLLQGMTSNQVMVSTTLVFFFGLTLLQALAIGIYMLVSTIVRLIPPSIALLIKFTTGVRRRVAFPMRSTRHRIGNWMRSVWQYARRRRLY